MRAAELQIVARREVMSDPPKLVDYHSAPEAITEELPDPYESIRDVARAWRELWDAQERARAKGLAHPERAGGVR